MKNKLICLAKTALFLAMVLVFAGCSAQSIEDLYALPQSSEEFVELERNINKILSSGADYSPPVAGSHRQSVQLEDLDRDGTNEVLIFLRAIGEEKPMKIYIFREDGGSYVRCATIEGEGTNFDRVNYIDMDGDGSLEIIVGRQISGSVKMLSIYSTKGYQMSVLINTDYTEFTVCSLTDYPGTDLLVMRTSTAEQAREATLYTCLNDGEVITSKARVSVGAESITRLRTTMLDDDKNAVLVEGTMAAEDAVSGEAVFTDIFTCIDNKLRNITADRTGVSTDTVRQFGIYCRDIDEDGRVEIPKLVPMISTSEAGGYWLTEWYSYTSGGKRTLNMTTYINTTDGWMFAVPEEWTDRITVRRAEHISGERIIILSYVEKGKITDIIAVYTLSGENKDERAKLSGRFTVGVEGERIFSARLYDHDLVKELKVTESFVRDNFSIIYSEWNTGET